MKLNRDAIIAWWYVWETVRECPASQVDKGADFRRLLCDLMKHYPNEYEALYEVLHADLQLRED
jgi:hypothetical protein